MPLNIFLSDIWLFKIGCSQGWIVTNQRNLINNIIEKKENHRNNNCFSICKIGKMI